MNASEALRTYYSKNFVEGSQIHTDLMNIADQMERESLKRQEPLLAADGLPYRVGEHVWHVDDGAEGVVTGIGESDPIIDGAHDFALDWTHKQPDSLERIEEDARKMFDDYWGCGDAECRCCPAVVDGKKPYERYDIPNGCLSAQRLDLLRRQREVLEKGQ